MIPRGPFSPKVSSSPSHFSDQEDEAQRAENLAIYDDQILCLFSLPKSKSFVLTTHRKQIESGSEAGLVMLSGK